MKFTITSSFIHSFLITLALIATTAPLLVEGHHDFNYTILTNVTIFKPLSDHAASIHEEFVYLTGGCDDVNGNTFYAESNITSCGSVSSSVYRFNVVTLDMEELPQMPTRRYRHTSTIFQNQLWVIGGRTFYDDLIPEIDIYDIATLTWSTIGTWENPTSDLGSFSDETYVYVVGGYGFMYNASSNLIRFSVAQDTGLLQQDNTTTVASLNVARGDIHAVTDGSKYAYVSGGWTDDDGFCAPLETVERYDFANDEWKVLSAVLNTPRADKALVLLDGKLLAMGGETALESKCSSEDMTNDTWWDTTFAADDIEVLDLETTDGDGVSSTWEKLTDLFDLRFRFAAVAYKEKVFLFGGQMGYDTSCNCTPTSDLIVVYYSSEEGDDIDIDTTDTDTVTSAPTKAPSASASASASASGSAMASALDSFMVVVVAATIVLAGLV